MWSDFMSNITDPIKHKWKNNVFLQKRLKQSLGFRDIKLVEENLDKGITLDLYLKPPKSNFL